MGKKCPNYEFRERPGKRGLRTLTCGKYGGKGGEGGGESNRMAHALARDVTITGTCIGPSLDPVYPGSEDDPLPPTFLPVAANRGAKSKRGRGGGGRGAKFSPWGRRRGAAARHLPGGASRTTSKQVLPRKQGVRLAYQDI